MLLCSCAIGFVLQAWSTSYMYPARSQTMLNDRELQHRSRNGAVLAPKVGLGGITHNNNCRRSTRHKARAVVAHLGNLVECFTVIDNQKACCVHIA